MGWGSRCNELSTSIHHCFPAVDAMGPATSHSYRHASPTMTELHPQTVSQNKPPSFLKLLLSKQQEKKGRWQAWKALDITRPGCFHCFPSLCSERTEDKQGG